MAEIDRVIMPDRLPAYRLGSQSCVPRAVKAENGQKLTLRVAEVDRR